MSSIILTVNLKGAISGPTKHTTKQIVTVDVTPIGSKQTEVVSRKIKHNDRVATECYKKINLSSEVVSDFQNGECPYWEKPHFWKTMNKKQRLESHLKRYDEGYGISYDFLEFQN